MTTYTILNSLEEVVKTVTVKSIEDLMDVIYDLKEYHGHQMNFTYEESK
jgi:hypothetical protein